MKIISVLSLHCSECLQVIQNYALTKRFLLLRTQERHMGPNQMNIVCVPKLTFASWPRIILQKVQCWKIYCYDENPPVHPNTVLGPNVYLLQNLNVECQNVLWEQIRKG
jgi:hypothetical protein